ncbi:hypothetical protein JTE90_029569 [Oedothorax gibbosus]|uniref:Uncharacterized protein n=1 Tax=Oedothorax gibbosus TaxID=931172 RepID=A0AAV6VBH5_9ARAC|nr:hypothetical protein JTE90_029569 [Oedothorax gibbosus]
MGRRCHTPWGWRPPVANSSSLKTKERVPPQNTISQSGGRVAAVARKGMSPSPSGSLKACQVYRKLEMFRY